MADKDIIDVAIDEVEERAGAAVEALGTAGGAAVASVKDVSNAVHSVVGEALDIPDMTLDQAEEFAQKRIAEGANILRALKKVVMP